MKQILITLASIICLVVTFLSAGIVLCMTVPQITENLSRATATVDTAHFTRDQLVKAAQTTRAFVNGEVDRQDLYGVAEEINKEANTQFSKLSGSDFAAVSDEYALDSNSISHLEDVKSLFANVKIAFGICLFGAILFLILLFVFCGRSAFGRALVWSGLIVIVGLVLLAIWAFADFNSMFNWLHSLFFAQDS